MKSSKNVFLERKDNNGYVVLPISDSGKKIISKSAVIIHLYYFDLLKGYLDYIDNIPEEIDVIVTSSENAILKELRERYAENKRISMIKKENRGRDISALLVACKDILSDYEYICFVHDKKPNRDYLEQDVENWNYNLWENMLSSSQYIRNVINYFEDNPDCGLLLPPEPFGEHLDAWQGFSWGNDHDYELTCELAQRLGINADIDWRYPSISIGSSFWVRVSAVTKLFKINWKYEDFVDEPMPLDGTISHAIERIIPYIVQDAGYLSKTVMTIEFSSIMMSFAHYYAYLSASILNYYMCIWGAKIGKLEEYKGFIDDCLTLFKRYSKVYLFGAGHGGVECLNFCRSNSLFPTGFVVSNVSESKEQNGLPIYRFDEIERGNNIGIIVSLLDEDMIREVTEMLDIAGFKDYIVWKQSRGIRNI